MPAWLRAIRPQFLTATAVPVVLGSVAAWRDAGGLLWPRFWLAAVGALLIHIGSNLANEYGDHLSGADVKSPELTPLSGGSHVIQEGLVAPRSILLASVVSLALGAALGLYLNSLARGNVILLIGLVGIFLGYFYSRPPLKLGYRGLGEVAVGVGFGPLMVGGSYYVQAERLPAHVLLLSLPIGLLIAAVLLINGFPDRETDLVAGKRTLVVLLGPRRAALLYRALLVGVYALIALLVAARVFPPFLLVAFASVPLAWRAYRVSRDSFDCVRDLLPANTATIGLHSLVGVLLILGLVLDRLTEAG
jgi:1,4-dihydroxy-2-naphthoate octaprenyltransferase